MPKNTKKTTNDNDNLAGRLDEVLSQGGDVPTTSYDNSCSDGSCSTGPTTSAPAGDGNPCPKCGKPQSYAYNMAHLPADRSHWPGCLCG